MRVARPGRDVGRRRVAGARHRRGGRPAACLSRPPHASRLSERSRWSEAVNQIVCASGVDLLMDFLEGVLPPEVSAALESHVAGCPRCTAFVASYQSTPRILREATD